VAFYFGFSISNDGNQIIFNLPLVESKCDLNLCDFSNWIHPYRYSDFPQLLSDYAPRVTHSLRQDILATLSELEFLANNGSASKNVSIGLSNKFFTLMPQNFGLEPPPILDSAEKISKLRKSLEFSMESFEKHRCFPNTNIEVLNRDTDEYRMIETYIENTSAQGYSLNVFEAYKVNRLEEEARYEPYKNFSNRTLLWHRLDVSNFKSILKNGIQIPPETQKRVSESGISFIDMVSKLATFYTPSAANVKLIALCEVALGNISQNNHGDVTMSLASGFDSVKACGKVQPNPDESVTTDDGVLVPLGKAVNAAEDIQTASLLDYNEYIVYNEKQIKLKYLIKVL
jgi:poly [ADP-ribose] polymerase 1